MTAWLKVTEKDAELVTDTLLGVMEVAYGYAG